MRSLSVLDDSRPPPVPPGLPARIIAAERRRRRRRRRRLAMVTAAGCVMLAATAGVFVLRGDDPNPRVEVADTTPAPDPLGEGEDWSSEMIAAPAGLPLFKSCVRLTVDGNAHEACMDARGASAPSFWRVEGRDFVLYPDWSDPETSARRQPRLPLTVELADTFLKKHPESGWAFSCGATLPPTRAETRPAIRKLGDALEAAYGPDPPPIMYMMCEGAADPIWRGNLQTTPPRPDGTEQIFFRHNGDHLEVIEPTGDPGRAQSADGSLSIPVVAGWHVVEGDPYTKVDVNTSEPFQSANVATFPVTVSSHLGCDLPVPLLDAMGPTDAFISVQETSYWPGASSFARPPIDDFVPTQPPENAYRKCLAQPEKAILFKPIAFIENGRFIQVYVVLGRDADPQFAQDVKSILEGLQIR